MSTKEKDIKFIKKGKMIAFIFGLLSIMNIIILIGRNSSYALFRRNVQSKRVIEIHTASEFPVKSGASLLKSKLGEGGLVGVPTNCSEESCVPITDKKIDKSKIREYRYSGLNVNNYIKFNNEIWRIIGIFKDEEGKEHIKIVRNEVLSRTLMPETYIVNEKNYKIGNYNRAYFDYDGDKNNSDNNWTDAGLMYWLNSKGTTDGYLKNLTNEAQNMIEETEYYLGNVDADVTAIQSYDDERKSTKCSVTSNSNNSNCYIWPNTQATWIGKIALMYQSDYGFSFDGSYWSSTKLLNDLANQQTILDTSWLYKDANNIDYEWFLSPSSYEYHNVTSRAIEGCVRSGLASDSISARPVLYLKSEVEITGGEGTSASPYRLETGVEFLKSKIGTDGLVGVTIDNTKTISPDDEVREYRYSGLGVKNYVYFNCKDKLEPNPSNCETWRIIGIFKDEDGQEHIKIVRNKMMAGEDMPLEYTVGSKTYKIRYGLSSSSYWNYDGSDYDNNWNDAGLMNWLNSKGTEDGYLQTLSINAQKMIAEAKYYLGNVYWDDTAAQSYEDERKSTKCSNSVTEYSHNSNCYIWPNNEATWTGKIALMYQSDYGFSMDSSYWSTMKLRADYETFRDSSWLYKEANHTLYEWFLSPSSADSKHVDYWYTDGKVDFGTLDPISGVRPTLYLKSDIKIIDGLGTNESPYILEC